MNHQHIIQGEAAAFAKAANKLVTTRDVSLSIRNVSFAGGRLAAVIEESSRPSNAPGSIIEVAATRQKDPQGYIDGLRAENPLWTAEAVFSAAEEDTKGKAATLVVAILRQP